MIETCKIENLYNLNETIAKEIFQGATYPWEVLPNIGAFIRKLGSTLSEEEYEKRGDDVLDRKNRGGSPDGIYPRSCHYRKDAQIRHCAFIRGNAIVGEGAVVGNSTELKNVILFNKVQVPHYNYVGDSILGYKAHMGAGSITSNVKSDKKLVVVKDEKERIETGLKKFGAMIGDEVEVGCGVNSKSGNCYRSAHQYLSALLSRPRLSRRTASIKNRARLCRKKNGDMALCYKPHREKIRRLHLDGPGAV